MVYNNFPIGSTPDDYDTVAMNIGNEDYAERNSFSTAAWSNMKLRADKSGLTYVTWDGAIPSTIARIDESPGGADNFNVTSTVPLAASLSSGA